MPLEPTGVLTLTRENWWTYEVCGQLWKINRLSDNSYEAVRVRPTRWFRATSLLAAQVSIDRRENPLIRGARSGD